MSLQPTAILVALTCLATWAPAQEGPTIRVPVRLVNLPVLVFSSDNRLIPDLHASNFRVLDNGRPQDVRLEAMAAPISLAVVIQANLDVRQYLPFLARTGSTIDSLLAGESGEVAVIAYNDDVLLLKPFGDGDASSAFRKISTSGKSARMIDAGVRAVGMLAERPAARTRVLLFIGQSMDSGSEARLDVLQQGVEENNVVVFALSLPLFGKSFVSDTFWLRGVGRAERGGYRAGADLKKLVAVLSRGAEAAAGTDPWAVLTAASGGTQLRFRTQRQAEDCIGAVGFQIRSAYLLSYYAGAEAGHHSVQVAVDVPGAKVFSRAGYWMAEY
jgi:VWFA-related protein